MHPPDDAGLRHALRRGARRLKPGGGTAPVATLTLPELAGEDVAALCHPHWRGVRTAAHAYGVPVIETADCAPHTDAIVDALLRAGVGTLVVHGWPPGSALLLRAATAWGIATRCVLHSSMAQHGGEAAEANVADEVLRLAGGGVIGRVGFVKAGLAEPLTALGFPAAHVPNRSPRLPEIRPVTLGAGMHVGVFAEPFWRKNVVTQLGAVALLDGATAHVLTRPDVAYLGALPVVEHGVLSWERFVDLQASVDLNLYVTLSECHPLSPIESYLCGVPSLMSRTSDVFRDDEELWALTTVDELDNPTSIAAAARRLLARSDWAVERARVWAEQADAEAALAWARFVDPS